MSNRRPRRLRTTAWLVLVNVAVLLFGFPQPAHAHAHLASTDPAQGAVLQTAPERVLFTFDEAVRGVPGGVQVFDAQGELVEARPTVQGLELDIALPKGLGSGTTVITWRVVSTDGHPISGALTFSVGAPTTGITPPSNDASSVPEVPWTLTLARAVGYVGLFLAAGLVAFAAMFLPTDPSADRPRRRLTVSARAAAAVAAGAWLAVLPITAVYLLGGGLGRLNQGATWSSLPPTEYAVTAAVTAGLALAVALLGPGLAARRRRVTAVAAAAIAVMAPALVGHTRAASPELLAIGADALHLVAGGVWLGGLAGLALTLPALSSRGVTAAEVLARFSTVAAGILAALVATGSLLVWRILGSWTALVDTSYGRLVLAKIAVVLTALAIAAWNRWSLLPRLKRAPNTTSRQARTRPVVRATAVEGAVLVVALLLTGFLVDTSPEGGSRPAGASAEAKPDTRTTTLGDITVRASLTPLTRGPSTIMLRLSSAAGEPAEGVAPPVVRLSSDGATLGDIPLTHVSAGIYTAQVTLPVPGTWRMQVSLRVTQFVNPVGELEFVVRG
ncbi:copper resistance CopC/CopD family protein [Dactylosporangium siamense]|uniref:Copper resistance protein C n=1 Tax=Dactylosporangium siamense TaxID=685454 RepID=A0A919Q2H4_9ACTN|nr:copper resistance protein CopC [Dactylosporangium siamense]GIG52670.1 copper resistance protein C [Dactylosporangium siamense]